MALSSPAPNIYLFPRTFLAQAALPAVIMCLAALSKSGAQGTIERAYNVKVSSREEWHALGNVMSRLDPKKVLGFNNSKGCNEYRWLSCAENFGYITEINIICSGDKPMHLGGVLNPRNSTWDKLTQLSRLVIHGCGIIREIPVSLNTLSRLTYLDLSFNNLTDGTKLVPSSFPSLSFVLLANNNFSGALPNSWHSPIVPPSLRLLSVMKNKFSGYLSNSNSTVPSYLNLYNNPICSKPNFSESPSCKWSPPEFCLGQCGRGYVPDFYNFFFNQSCTCASGNKTSCFIYKIKANATVAAYNDRIASEIQLKVRETLKQFTRSPTPLVYQGRVLSPGTQPNRTSLGENSTHSPPPTVRSQNENASEMDSNSGEVLPGTQASSGKALLMPHIGQASGGPEILIISTIAVIFQIGIAPSDNFKFFQFLSNPTITSFPFGSPLQSSDPNNPNPSSVLCSFPRQWMPRPVPRNPPRPAFMPPQPSMPAAPPPAPSSPPSSNTALIVGATLGVLSFILLLVLGLLLFFYFLRKRSTQSESEEGDEDESGSESEGEDPPKPDSPGSNSDTLGIIPVGLDKHALPSSFVLNLKQSLVQQYSLEEIAKATQNWDQKNLLGEGAYGKVYLGSSSQGTPWAVKRMEGKSSARALQDFRNEIELISRTSHSNLVKLFGFCDEEGEQILVYEYVPKGNLRQHIRPRSGQVYPYLSFEQRLQIAVGAAEGLRYLHNFTNPPVVHRDIKCENILLDENLEAKVADFGFFKSTMGASSSSDAFSTRVLGTPGYVDPEYYFTSRVTTKCDVYSFGVVLWELITGQPPIIQPKMDEKEENEEREELAYAHLPKWASKLCQEGRLEELIDPKLKDQHPLSAVQDMAKVADACTKDRSKQRPDMSEVALRLIEIQKTFRPKADSDEEDADFLLESTPNNPNILMTSGESSTSRLIHSTTRKAPTSGSLKGR